MVPPVPFLSPLAATEPGRRNRDGERTVMASKKSYKQPPKPEKTGKIETTDTKILAFVGRCDNAGELESLIKNATKLGNATVAEAAFRKRISLIPDASPGTVEHDFWQTVHAFEYALTADRGKNTRLSRTRQKVAKVGVVQDRKSTRLTPVTPRSTLFPYTTLFRSFLADGACFRIRAHGGSRQEHATVAHAPEGRQGGRRARSEEHTSNSSHTEIYTLSLHDALPIFSGRRCMLSNTRSRRIAARTRDCRARARRSPRWASCRRCVTGPPAARRPTASGCCSNAACPNSRARPSLCAIPNILRRRPWKLRANG